MDVTVLVGTYGDETWAELARTRAIPSAERQAPVIHEHADTLAAARNAAAERARSEWLCFLDADGELSPGYVDAMASADGDLRCPRVQAVTCDRAGAPAFSPRCDLREGNWLPIGTLVRRDAFLAVGGFREWPFLEDWCLWQRCWKAGATIGLVPDAVYRAHKRRGSRARFGQAGHELERVFDAIRRRNFPELFREPVISVAIKAHPSRKPLVAKLARRLPDAEIVWDRRNDEWDTSRRALLAHDPSATHHIIVEDDALVCRDLAAGTARLLDRLGVGSPLGLYFGAVRPHGTMMSAAARLAAERGCSFIRGPGPTWGVAVCLPVEHIAPLVEHGDRDVGTRQYDLKMHHYFQRVGVSCLYPLPSLVDHRGGDTPSLVRSGAGQDRRHAHWFLGENTSALNPAWEGGILDLGEAAGTPLAGIEVYVLNDSDRIVSRGGLVFPPGKEVKVALHGSRLKEVRACRHLRIY